MLSFFALIRGVALAQYCAGQGQMFVEHSGSHQSSCCDETVLIFYTGESIDVCLLDDGGFQRRVFDRFAGQHRLSAGQCNKGVPLSNRSIPSTVRRV